MNFVGLWNDLGELTVTGLAQGSIYALFALGYTLVYGVLRLINFAHSEVFMMGTFAAVITWNALGVDENAPTPSLGVAIGFVAIGIVVAMIVSGLTALFVELIAYRQLRRRNAPPLAFLITAIGASVAISEAVGVATHRQPHGMPVLIAPHELFSIGSMQVTNVQVFLLVLAIGMMALLDVFIQRSRLGRGVRAVAQNPDTAALMGVNKNRVISLVFLLGGLMAGVAAVMYNLKIGNTRYNAGFDLGVKAFTAAVLGGIGNLRGSLLGGLMLGLVEAYGSGLFGSQWRDLVAFVLLVLILMFRPTGLLGESLGRARA